MTLAGNQPRGILFDLDGTLIDTAPDFHRVLNSHRSRHGLGELPFPQVRQAVSEGARALVKLGFEIQEEHPEFEPLRQEFLQLYLDNICVDSCLFPGFSTLLNELDNKGIVWGIVTNKPRLYSEALLAALNLSGIAVLVCPDDVSKTKPDPEPLFKAASQLNLPASSFWYIGDHYRDILAGRNAGMTTIAAAYGYIPQDDAVENWEADYIIQAPQDLASLLMA